MKGIILTAGKGTRLYPITTCISKSLVPVYDKPLIYYPVAVLLQAGIRDILIITSPHDLASYHKCLGDGSFIGCHISYAVQEVANGLAQAFVIGKEFIGKDKVCLILGDNIFYGEGLPDLMAPFKDIDGAGVFAYSVKDPSRFGVVAFDEHHVAISIEEKPEHPKSSYAVPGLYFYDNDVIDIAGSLQPSARGEYEISDVNAAYLKAGKLKVGILDESFKWLDAGTFESLFDATVFVRDEQEKLKRKIGCIEEIAYEMGFIDGAQLAKLAASTAKSGYGIYLKQLL